MRFLKGFNSKKKDKGDDYNDLRSNTLRQVPSYQYGAPRSDLTVKLPAPILERIFAFVCPHARDSTYESCEQSAVEDACMLCDLRDLAHCASVSRRWRKLASNVLYHSIRIDSVHYCEREEILAEKRKRRSFFERNAEPEDTAQQRLRFLCRTLRDDTTGLGYNVQFFKIPYMTRETCKADLARTVAVLPKLQYVDLPEGFFTGDPSCSTLRQELEHRCSDIRKMTYMGGSEVAFEAIGSGNVWRNLRSLDLRRLDTDPTILRHVLASLSFLRALKVSEMSTFDNTLFQDNPRLPPFPALEELLLDEIPHVTAEGMAMYLSHPLRSSSLLTLSVTSTGVLPSDLQQILSLALNLRTFSIIEQISTPFPTSVHIPALSSRSLQILHYEITSTSTSHSYRSATASYYAYLTTSLLSNGLPHLQQLYVRDPDFPESLLDFTPPRPLFAADYHQRPMSSSSSNYGSPPRTGDYNSHNINNPYLSPSHTNSRTTTPRPPASTPGGLTQELEVYTKGLEEMEWNFARVEPAAAPGRRGSMTAMRPVSVYGLAAGGAQMSPSWTGSAGGEVRKSVMVGNGFGGFLAVPVEGDGRPRSSAGSTKGSGAKRGTGYDMWR